MAQHVFAVVAGGLGFLHAGEAGGVQAGQQHGGFHLGRGHRHPIFQRQRVDGALDRDGQATAPTRHEACASRGQGISHPPHRPGPQAGVAGHHREQRVRGQDTAQEARGGARVAHIQDIGGFGKAADASAGDTPDAVRVTGNLGPQRAHGTGGAQHVLPGQKAGNAGFANRQRTKHQGAVADRLVAGHSDMAMQRRGGAMRPEGA